MVAASCASSVAQKRMEKADARAAARGSPTSASTPALRSQPELLTPTGSVRIPASHRNTTAKRYRDYAAENNVMPFLESMVTEMMLAQPDDTIGFMA